MKFGSTATGGTSTTSATFILDWGRERRERREGEDGGRGRRGWREGREGEEGGRGGRERKEEGRVINVYYRDNDPQIVKKVILV